MIHILFLNRRFEYGGAERQLVALAKGLRQAGLSVRVATFYLGGPLQKDLEAADVFVSPLGKRTRWDIFGFFTRLISLMRDVRPDVLHGYLSTANILTVLVKPLFPTVRIVWGLRASDMELERYSRLERVQYWVECRLSRFADMIILNSNAGLAHAMKHGFPRKKMVVIHNGIDVERFCPDLKARDRLRKEVGITQTEVLIGLVGRFDPMKGHETFLRAAALLIKERGDIRFLCVGNGPYKYKRMLQELGEQLGLDKRLIWIDSSDDMVGVYNGLDIATSSSSFGEGFSNVIGEAMACGIPCVVTDVGDSAIIVGNTGEVVPQRNPKALAEGWSLLLHRLRLEPNLGAQARMRIIQHFGIDTLVERTHAVLTGLQHGRRSY